MKTLLRIDLDRGRVVEERVLFFADGAAEAGADDFVVLAAVLVDVGAQEVVDEVVVLRADLLDGDDLEVLDDRGQRRHDVRLLRFRFAEDLDVERSDADGRAAGHGSGRRRGWRPALWAGCRSSRSWQEIGAAFGCDG